MKCRALIRSRRYRVLKSGRVALGPTFPCPNEALDGATVCVFHDHYFRVVLADDRYKDEPPPRVRLVHGEAVLDLPLKLGKSP